MKLLKKLSYLIALLICGYICSYIGMFEMTGLPARNSAGWLGPTLRFETETKDEQNATFYEKDDNVYGYYKPLNSVWLKFKSLPKDDEIKSGQEPSPGKPSGESSSDSPRSYGRGQRNNDSANDSATSTTSHSNRETSGGQIENRRERGERGNRGNISGERRSRGNQQRETSNE